jgi:Protein of unknown function (DUF917)
MIKAVGILNVAVVRNQIGLPNGDISEDVNVDDHVGETQKAEVPKQEMGSMARPKLGVDLKAYKPIVKNGVWHISPVDIDFLASGSGILGTGGGVSSYNMAVYVLDILRKGGEITVVKPEALKDDRLCVFRAGFDAPSVSNERIASGREVFDAIDAVNKVMGYNAFAGRVADEIGGGNGIVTFPSSAHYSRPVVDCDLIGRGTLKSAWCCSLLPSID